MSRAARLQVAETGAGPAGDEHATSAALDWVVQLFARSGGPAAQAPSEGDLSASLDLVRRVAERVRDLRERAQATTAEAHRSVADARASEQAARHGAAEAEARMRTAQAEAERADRQIRDLSAKLAAAEARAAQAEARAHEAQTWLRRLHDCMANEFIALTIAPA